MDARQFRDLVAGQTRGFGPSALRTLLGMAEIPYCSVVSLRNVLYDRGILKEHRIPLPVISVGNPTLGGTGKSPLVAWIAQYFQNRGLRPGLISRGYGRPAPEANGSSETDGQNRRVNDEFLELAFRLPDVPHIQNPDRVAAAQEFLRRADVDLLILDDAMQHRRIARDLDIALLDATEPFGYEHVFPRGMLREPLRSLRRADFILLSRADTVSEEKRKEIRDRVHSIAPDVPWGEMAHVPESLVSSERTRRNLSEIAGKKAVAFCGIGNPDAFRGTLNSCGVDVVELISFPDHHRYTAEDLERIENAALRHHVELILCTMKDLVKIPETRRKNGIPIFAVTIGIRFMENEPEFAGRLSAFCP